MFRRGSRRRRDQRGFALLFVFAMAAAVAIMLYLEMPRIAFEHQRDKEEMLVQRGEQFTRGITVFFRKNNRFPQSMDELEKFNNVRYLRRRYKDPMTGSDEWRLIHVDAAGRYLDSLVHKPPGQEEEQKQRHLLEADVQGVGATAVSATEESQGGPAALQRRGSDIIIPNNPGAGRSEGADPNAAQGGDSRSGDESQPAAPQPTPVPGEAPPVQSPGAINPAFRAQDPNQGMSNQSSMTGNRQAGFGGPTGPNQPGLPTTMPGQQTGQQLPGQQQQQSGGGFGFSGGGFGMNAQAPPPQSQSVQDNLGQQGQSGFGQPPNDGRGMPQQRPQQGPAIGSGGQQPPRTTFAQPNMQGNPLPAIQNLMSGSRPPGSMQGGFGQNPQSGAVGGIAGVASTVDLEGIKVYNERTNYKEWEFLFDLQKAQQAMGNAGGGQRPMGGRGQGGQGTQPGGDGPGFGGPSGNQRPGVNQGGPFGPGGGQQGNRQGGFGTFSPPGSGQGRQ